MQGQWVGGVFEKVTELRPGTDDFLDWRINLTHSQKYNFKDFGEHSANGKLNGRGLRIEKYGNIHIRHFQNGDDAPGPYIIIYKSGDFWVGEYSQEPNATKSNKGV